METYSSIQDPENCPIEELKAEVERLGELVDFFESKQIAFKVFINSTYGAIANAWFTAHNTRVAESITLQGQDLNHFSENKVNEYFSGVFQKDAELHKELGISTDLAEKVDIGKCRITKRPPLEGNEFWYLHGNQSLTVAGDTDSFSGDTILEVNDVRLQASEFFKYCKALFDSFEKGEKEIIDLKDANFTVQSLNKDTMQIENKRINYAYRHKVTKPKWRIKSKSGEKIDITNDHSIYVYRNGNVVKVKPSEIDKETDKLIVLKK